LLSILPAAPHAGISRDMVMRFAALAALASLANCDDDADAAQPLSNRMGKAAFEALKHDVVGRSFAEAKELFAEAGFPVGTHSAQHAAFPQDKIEHMVVLFVENRAADHIFGCMLGDHPEFDGIPTRKGEWLSERKRPFLGETVFLRFFVPSLSW
jgi:phospholipase C